MSSFSQLLHREIPNTLDRPAYFRLSIGIISCFALFHYSARAAHLPPVDGLGPALLQQPSPALAVALVATALVVAAVAGRFIVGDLHNGDEPQFEGGLFAALLGATALVFRLGSVRYALYASPDSAVFILLAVELLLLYAVVALCFFALKWVTSPHPPSNAQNASPFMAVATHAIVMSACMIYLAQTEQPAQALGAVGISALLASMAAHIAFPRSSSFCYWISPLFVGLLGYGFCYFSPPPGLAIGFPDGLFGALARPMPLAYATAGPAGAIFGYWKASRWLQTEVHSHDQPALNP